MIRRLLGIYNDKARTDEEIEEMLKDIDGVLHSEPFGIS